MGARTEQVLVRFTEEEAAMVRRAAEAAGQTPATYLRSCALADRAMEGDPVALRVVKENILEAVADLFPGIVRRKRHA